MLVEQRQPVGDVYVCVINRSSLVEYKKPVSPPIGEGERGEGEGGGMYHNDYEEHEAYGSTSAVLHEPYHFAYENNERE